MAHPHITDRRVHPAYFRSAITPEFATKMHVIVVGCGIAGLACSIGFRKHGHDVTILERAPQVAAVCCTLSIETLR